MGKGWVTGCRACQQAVLAGDSRPFSPAVQTVVEAWAERRIDLSEDAIAQHVPQVVEVVLAREFGDFGVISRSWYHARIALLLMAAERVGAPRKLAAMQAKAEEDAAWGAMKGVVGAG